MSCTCSENKIKKLLGLKTPLCNKCEAGKMTHLLEEYIQAQKKSMERTMYDSMICGSAMQEWTVEYDRPKKKKTAKKKSSRPKKKKSVRSKK